MSPKNATNAASLHLNPEFLARLFLGSTALGGVAGLTTALMRQRQTIMDDEDEDESNKVELPSIPEIKQANLAADAMNLLAGGANMGNNAYNWLTSKFKSAPPEGGTGPAPSVWDDASKDPLSPYDLMLGGGAAVPLGLLGGYQLSRSMYQKWRRRDLQDKLQAHQSAYMQALQQAAGNHKQAAMPEDGRRPLSIGTLATMAVAGLPVVSGLAAYMMTNRLLDKEFGSKPVRDTKPLQLRYADTEPNEEDVTKQASYDFFLNTAMTLEKEASGRAGLDINNVVGAVLDGRLEDMTSVMCKAGADAMFDYAEGCAKHVDKASPLTKMAALRAVNSSALGAPVRVLAASVFHAISPSWRKQAQQLQEMPKLANAMQDYVGTLTLLAFAHEAGPEVMSKAAAMMPPTTDMSNLFLPGIQAAGPVGLDNDTTRNDGGTLATSAASTTHSQEGNKSYSDSMDSANPQDDVDNILNSASNLGQ
jgi:hypothetical protein